MTTDRSVIGVVNPYALAELVVGRRIDWTNVVDPRSLLEVSLGMPIDRLLDPRSGSILYRGLVPAKNGKLVRLAPADLVADVEHRLSLHTTFAASAMSTRPAPSMQLLLERPKNLAAARLSAAALAGLKAAANTDPATVWVDPGSYVTDSIEAGDPVQGALGDCYFIGALAAVAWTMPSVLAQRAGTLSGIPSEVIRFSPGYYGPPGHPTDSGPLFTDLGVTERLPEQAGSGVPMYAQSSDAGEIWPGVWEKAFAKWRTGDHDDQPDYAPIEGGDCLEATRAIVGRNRQLDWYDNEHEDANGVLQVIKSHTRGGRTISPMTAWTYSSADEFPNDGIARNYDRSSIVFNHCYTLLGWTKRDNVDYVVLRNPWGFHEATRSDRAEGGTVLGLAVNTNGVFALPVEVFRRYYPGFGVII
jgi:hypothetical protein